MKNQHLLKFPILLLVAINILSACSIGTNRVTIPNLSEVSLSSAESTLLELNLIPFYITNYDDNVPEGKVIGTIPEADSKVDAFSRVQIIVSDGPKELISTKATILPLKGLRPIISNNPRIIEGMLEIYLTFYPPSPDAERSEYYEWRDRDFDGFGDGTYIVKDRYSESLELPLTIEYESLRFLANENHNVTLRIPLKNLGLSSANQLEIELLYSYLSKDTVIYYVTSNFILNMEW
jgi:hypothetical protein